MARIKLELPSHFPFSFDLQVRITHVNYRGHLGNDALLGVLHEARAQFLAHYGWSEMDIGGVGIILADSVIVYKSEAFTADKLLIAVTVADFNPYGCDFFYLVTEKTTGREVARAKTGIVFFDYPKRAIQNVPQIFLDLFQPNVATA